MDLIVVGEIISEREIENDEGRLARVVVGKPQDYPEGSDSYCPYQTTGIGDEKVRYAVGIDTVQALVLALQGIDAHLVAKLGTPDGILNWLGQQVLKSPPPDSI